MRETIRWLFFDIGGTLVDEIRQEAYIVREIQKAFVRLGVEYTTERIYGKIVRATEACRPSPGFSGRPDVQPASLRSVENHHRSSKNRSFPARQRI